MESGLILINKKKKISSQKVDTILKRKYNLNKVGHLGTLDPLAEGLLVVGINRGTRFFKYFEDLDKVYILRIRLGATSESLDYEKELTNIIDCDLSNKEEYIDKLLNEYPKEYYQVPPIYSAIKKDGIPLYKYANKGETIDIKSRKVKIYEIKRISPIEVINNQTYFDIYMHVSKGYYIRSFSKEFGDLLNVPSMADNIKRIKVGNFKLENSFDIDEEINLEKEIIKSIDYLNFKEYKLNEKEYNDVLVGKSLIVKTCNDSYIHLTYNKESIAIYKLDDLENIYRMDLLIKL